MQYIIGLFIFWCCILGYGIFLKSKISIKNEFIIPIVFVFILLIIYCSGLLNIITLSSFLIVFIGIILWVYVILRKRDALKEFITDNNIIFTFILILFISIFYINLHPMHYDNFSHWAAIVKDMWVNNALPNFESTIIEFKSYQPGTACFIYFVGTILGRTEGVMVVAQNYMLVIFASSILAMVDKKAVLSKILLLMFIIFISLCNVPFYDLLVDVILSVFVLFIICLIFTYHKNLKKLYYLLLPNIIVLLLIKNSGLVFAFIIILMYLIISIKYRQSTLKSFSTWKYTLYFIGITILTLYTWSQHVEYVFGEMAKTSPHSLSLSNFSNTLSSKGLNDILNFMKSYFTHFLDILNNPSQIILIIINIILLLLLITFKDKRRNIFTYWVLIDGIYILYYIALMFMYILSMSNVGSFELAGFDRYLYTGTFICIGILIILLFNVYCDNKNVKSKIYMLFCICLLFIGSLFLKQISFTSFFGNQGYKKTILFKLDKLASQLPSDISDNDIVYLYCDEPIPSNGYYIYAARYKFNHGYLVVIDDVSKVDVKTNITTIVTLDNNQMIKKYVNDNQYKKIDKNVYQLKL